MGLSAAPVPRQRAQTCLQRKLPYSIQKHGKKDDKAATEWDRTVPVMVTRSTLERLKFLGLIPTEQVAFLYLLGNTLIAMKFLKIWKETEFVELGLC